MAKKESVIHSHIAPGAGRLQISKDQITHAAVHALQSMGIGFDAGIVRRMVQGLGLDSMGNVGFDSLQPTMNPGTIPTPIQFLQEWLPGFVNMITAARKIDDLVGITTAGDWEDEQVVQGVLEPTGSAVPYTDYGNVPLASWNPAWETRTIVRFEMGMRVGRLEEMRAAKTRINSAAQKRASAALALEIARNRVGFYGYNDGDGQTYGFLNDPNLPAYVGVTGAQWTSATFLVITAQLRTAFAALRAQSKDTIDPTKTPLVLVLPTNRIDYLSVTSDYGNSVREWLTETYPNVRIESAPELDGANGGANVFYLYAERVEDGESTDNGRVIDQIVPAKFQVVGVAPEAKGYVEDYTNATAGIMAKRPFAIVRYTGI